MMTSSPGDSLDNSVGTKVSFTCEANGVNGVGLVRRWYRNGEEVSSGPLVVIRGSNMTTYGLLEGDSGIVPVFSVQWNQLSLGQWRVLVSSEYCTCTVV